MRNQVQTQQVRPEEALTWDDLTPSRRVAILRQVRPAIDTAELLRYAAQKWNELPSALADELYAIHWYKAIRKFEEGRQ